MGSEMQGTVLSFQPETNTGLISGHDGNRYNFVMLEWKSENKMPREGQLVDFEIDDKAAKHIIVMKKTGSGNQKSKVTAMLLAFFLGGFGVHKFYLGRTVWGVVYLLFFWTLVPACIAFIEFLIYAFMSEDRFDEKYNQ